MTEHHQPRDHGERITALETEVRNIKDVRTHTDTRFDRIEAALKKQDRILWVALGIVAAIRFMAPLWDKLIKP